jgi:hypothetical protein
MFARKPISIESVPGALAKAERYRLLHEPTEAESICRDVLDVDPDNREALVNLILALTDEIPEDKHAFAEALATALRMPAAYDRAYYAGICWERRAKAHHRRGGHGIHSRVYEWLVQALHLFEEAERQRMPGNDDAVLRWNACVRYLERHTELAPQAEEALEPIASE